MRPSKYNRACEYYYRGQLFYIIEKLEEWKIINWARHIPMVAFHFLIPVPLTVWKRSYLPTLLKLPMSVSVQILLHCGRGMNLNCPVRRQQHAKLLCTAIVCCCWESSFITECSIHEAAWELALQDYIEFSVMLQYNCHLIKAKKIKNNFLYGYLVDTRWL